MKKIHIVSVPAIFGVLIGVAFPGMAQTLTFSNTNLATGSGPAMVLPIDVNGDGHPGLVCGNFGFRFGAGFGTGGGTGTTLSVFTNDGAGNLSPSATLTVGLEPAGLAVADVNGDGALDLISANVGGNSLTVLTNNGKGGFVLEGTFAVGGAPVFVAAADVNGDGKVDLISVNYGDSSLTFLTNDGHGSFKSSATLVAGSDPNCVAAADINGDGSVDLICANSGNSTLLVLTNNGRGVFNVSATINVTGGAPSWVIATDVDRDGTLDLVSVNGVGLNVFTNNGHGNFGLKSTVSTSGAGMVTAADFNGDGKIDLVCPNNGNGVQGSATVFTNDGNGNFTANAAVPIGITGSVNYPNFVTAADFNGDGNMDFAVSCFGTATLTEAAQSNVPPRPAVAITSPANDSVIPSSENFVIDTTASSSTNKIEVMLFYEGTNVLGAGTNAPFDLPVRAGLIPAGSHGLQVETVDSAGHIGWSPEVQVNITSTSKAGSPPVVSVTSPTNGASFSTSESVTVKATTSSAVIEVELYVDGQVSQTTVTAPYNFQIPAGTLSQGSHTLQVVAVASGGATGSSDVIQFTVSAPGTALINFDALNTSAGAVTGTPLANYLEGYGVTLENVTDGSAIEAVNTNSLDGNVRVEAPSSPNIFTQTGLNQPVSFTLAFSTPLQSFGFTRAGLSASSGLVSHPQWTATIFGANGVELGSVSEALILGASVPERTFVLTGNGIASVRFDSDSQGTAAFSAVLLDDLILNYNPATPALSVALSVTSPPTNDIVAPATVVLSANVNDSISASYYVSFFAGPTLLGTASNAPYQITLTNVLPGNYSLQAQVVDASGQSALSTVTPITVQTGAESTPVNFDTLNASRGPVTGAAVATYLASFGVKVASLSPGTAITVDSQEHIAGGGMVLAASPPNVLTQTGSNGPVQFTLSFAPLLSQFGFTRPELLANPYVSHPTWQVTAYDGAGDIVDQVSEGEIDSSTNVGAREFILGGLGGPGIAEVQFASQGTGLTTFNGMLLDNFVLTTNKAAFPPAVAITGPISGIVLAAPPAVTVTAAASDAAGIASVSFYANGVLLGAETAGPYAITWTNPAAGNYSLTAVASNVLGLAWTSAPVNVVIRQSADQFGISSQPASQTVPAGASVTFGVVVTGTNGATFQWSRNGAQIPGATDATLVLPPPIQDSDAGTYTVAATAVGTTLVSSPAVLTVVDPPVITTQPAGQTVPTGAEVTLSVAAAGGGPFAYQWLLNGVPIPGATNSIYSILAAQPFRSGNYQVSVAGQASQTASVLSAVAPVIVETPITIPETNDTFASRAAINPLLGPVSDSNRLAAFEKGEPLPDGLAGGNSIWFTWRATFTGTLSLTTQGSDFDTVMAVYTGTELSNLKPVAADDDSGGFLTSLVTFNVTTGTVYQIAVDGFQGASGRVVLGLPAGTGYEVLNPSSGDSLPVIVTGPASRVVAPGATVTLSVQARSATTSTCQWRFETAPITGATGSSLVIKNFQRNAVGRYDVIVANAAGSVRSEPANLEIGENPGGKPTSTENKFVNSTAAPSPAKLALDLRPFDVGGDTRGFSVSQIFSTIGSTREPGEPEPCGQAGGASQWFLYEAPASGILEINTDGSSFNTLLGVYSGLGTSFSNLVEVGCGYTTNYVTQGQPSVILPDAVKGTIYYILVDGYQGASGVAQLQIGLGQALSFRSLPTSQLVTAGSNATFEVSAIGSTPSLYQWQLNGANVARATNSTYKITNAQEGAVGNYTVIVSNVVGAVTSSPPAALSLQYAPAILSGPTNETVTVGQRAKFAVTAIGVNVKTNPFVCQWYFNGAPAPKATNLSLSFAAALTNEGNYYLVIKNSYGSATSATAALTVLSKTSVPDAAAILAPSAAGAYSGLFYPAGGATETSAGFFTATVSGRAGAFTANILLDGCGYPFAGKFDAAGDAQSIVSRAGKTSVTAFLHLNLDSSGGQLTGVISNADWLSPLQANHANADTASDSALFGDGQYALVTASDSVAPAGTLTLANTPGGAVLVKGTLADGAEFLRSAPMVKGPAIPLYVPLYSGKGMLLGWITFTNSPAQTDFGQAAWIKPGFTNLPGVFIVK